MNSFHRVPARVLAMLLVCLAAARAADNVTITEIAANNSSGLRDEDGAYSDWIELFNAGTNAVNLDGWFLSDSPLNLTKWRFPATNLPPSQFLIVFASSKNRAVAGAPLHANFGLSAGGEYLALVRPDGVTLASEFDPFPEQFANISWGIGQNLQVTALVSNKSHAVTYVPSNNTLGLTWTAPTFGHSTWRAGTNGVGYENAVPGFAVKNIRANIGVCDLATADSVLANPSQQAAVFTVTAPVVNYMNTGGGANFGGDATFPGFTIGVDIENFVTEATGILTIPSSGNWTFGVNSDDGFRCVIGANTFSYPTPRGPGDTFATFALAAGEYAVRLVFYECGGGSEVEFFAAPGTYSGFNAAFRLVGDTGGGGLAVKSLPQSSGSSGSLRPLIATDVQMNMLNRNASAYVRLPFQVPNPTAFSSLTLKVKYDDGFVAYLNGTEVARRNTPATPLWNSAATISRTNSAVLAFEDIDLTSRLNLLVTGSNLLAFHGLNFAANESDFVIYAELAENKVLGLTNRYFGTPTPGGFNSSASYAFVENLKFTPGRGWFDSTNFTVTITSATPGVTIRYTTNGAWPGTTTGFVYNAGGILISGTTLIRAIGFRDGFEPTEIETHSYIFLNQVQAQSTNSGWAGGSSGDYTLAPAITQSPLYGPTFKSDLTAIPTLSIVAAWEDMFGPSGVWSNPQAEGVAWERPCSLEYIRPDSKKGFNVNCGVRIQGGASRSLVPKHGLRVLFKNIYGPGKLDYELFEDSPVHEFDTLTLHATFNDHWLWGGTAATMQRDQWCRDTQNAMGGYGPHGTYVHLYLNGLYWGLYNVGEKGDGSYAAMYLGGEKEEYDAFNSDENIDGDTVAWNAMHAIANAAITNDLAYTNMANYLNLPNFIDYMLVNFYAANTDWPWHNWNAARRRVTGAGFHFFSWDAEWTFGIGNDVNTDRTGLSDGSPGRLYAALRSHPEFRRQFGDHAQKHLFHNGALTAGPAQARWQTRAAEIDRAIVPESARWGAGNTRQTWLSAEANVLSWFPARAAILVNQLRNAGLYPSLNAPGFSQIGGMVPPGYALTLTNPNPSGGIYYTRDGADPRLWGGALAPTALAYSTPLVLTNATTLRARIRDGANWSALVEATFYTVQDFAGFKITEIMYHPPPFSPYVGDDFEFVELKNTGTNTLDLSGLRFTDGFDFVFTNGTRLASNAFFVLARNPAAFGVKYPGVPVSGVYTGRLDNGGEKLTLSHVLGTNTFSFSYNNAVPWPITPDGYGFSLVRANLAGNPDSPSSWRPSANPGGSPGADDPTPFIAPVVISEILTHTDPPLLDAIELRNPTATNVNVGGWFLSDSAIAPQKFRLPEGTMIGPGGHLVIYETNFNPQPGFPPSFALDSHGESLFLFSGDAASELTGYSHSFEYGAAANGVSFGRHLVSTGDEYWPAQIANSLGGANAGPRVGPLVLNEIMYHPAAGYDEFVEVFNLSSNTVPLYDPASPTNGWKLSGLAYAFSNNLSVPPGGFLLLVSIEPSVFRTKYSVPAPVQIVGPFAGLLQDSGENLRLLRPDAPDTNGVPYIVVDEVRYNDKLPWPLGADGDGPSLQRRAPGDYGNEPTNWFASGITPGGANVFNQAPACVITSPTNNAQFNVPANVAVTVQATDPDGSIVRVEFYDGDVLLGQSVTAPFSFVWSNAPVGSHSLIAKARDNGLAVTPSAPVSLTVNPPPVGSGVGLRGDYYDNMDFTGVRVRRIDSVVNFDWGSGQPDAGIGPEQFSVRWLGQVQPRFTETYTFFVVGDDGVRLWVNNQLLLDRWIDQGPTEYSGFIQLQAGQLYDIKFDYYENGGGAVARLLWASPSVPKEVIPGAQLYPPATSNLPPAVTLTSPATGAVFVATSTVNLTADATDPDGAILKVEFFNGATKLGEDASSPFHLAWSVPAGAHTLRAVATDDSALVRTSAPVNISVVAGFTSNLTLIATGAVWKYLDNGSDQGSAWTATTFNDSGWSNGLAELGYGDAGEGRPEATVVSFGPNSAAKYITTYFRRSFSLTDPAAFSALDLRVMRDDGVIVYLNGSEIFRNGMPGGAVGYQTPASAGIGGVDEYTYLTFPVNPGYLVFGANVVAAEIHQNGGGSSDISFDFELAGSQSFIAPYITNQPASQTVAQGSVASLAVGVTGTAPMRFQWSFHGTNLPAATNATLSFPSVSASHDGPYLCLITNLAGSATSAVATITVSVSDSDGDGLPDAWELAHGLTVGVNDSGLDPDLDTMTNLAEFIAGTDPQDGQSFLKVDSITPVSGSADIRFLAVSNRTYSLLYKPAVGPGPWVKFTDVGATPTNRMALISDDDPGSFRVYRLVTPALP